MTVRGFLHTTGFLLWSVAVALLLLELTLMLFKPAPLFFNINVFTGVEEYILSPNRKLVYVPQPNSREFNEHGYRGPVFPMRRVPGKTRYVFIGDSVVEGASARVEQRYSNVLNDLLGSSVEVINLGVRGYNIVQEVEYFKEKGLDYKPDQVVFNFSHNDAIVQSGELFQFDKKLSELNLARYYSDYYRVRSAVELLLLRLNIYRFFKWYATSHKTILDESKNMLFNDAITTEFSIDDEKLRELMVETVKLSTSRKFDLLFVFLPDNSTMNVDFDQFYDRLKTMAFSLNIPAIDLDSYVQEKYGEAVCAYLFIQRDPCHFSGSGHRIIARQLNLHLQQELFQP